MKPTGISVCVSHRQVLANQAEESRFYPISHEKPWNSIKKSQTDRLIFMLELTLGIAQRMNWQELKKT